MMVNVNRFGAQAGAWLDAPCPPANLLYYFHAVRCGRVEVEVEHPISMCKQTIICLSGTSVPCQHGAVSHFFRLFSTFGLMHQNVVT